MMPRPLIVRAVDALLARMKLPFLPALTFRTTMTICACAWAVMLGNIAGSYLGWWAPNEDVRNACLIVFVLLGLTPLHFPPRVVYVATIAGLEQPMEWVEVSEADARRLMQEPHWRVRRLVVRDGRVIEDR